MGKSPNILKKQLVTPVQNLWKSTILRAPDKKASSLPLSAFCISMVVT